MKKTSLWLSIVLPAISFAQLTVQETTSTTEPATEPATQVVEEKKPVETPSSKADSYDANKSLQPAQPHLWGIGAGLSLSNVTTPSALKNETGMGPGFQLWGSYQWNEHLGSQWGIYHYDSSDSSFGITSYKYSLLLQTGIPKEYAGFIGLGSSINNISKSVYTKKDSTQFGLSVSAGVYLPASFYNRCYFVPQLEWNHFLKKGDRDSINQLAALISLAIVFDEEDFLHNVRILSTQE
jgi:hypothetical protein